MVVMSRILPEGSSFFFGGAHIRPPPPSERYLLDLFFWDLSFHTDHYLTWHRSHLRFGEKNRRRLVGRLCSIAQAYPNKRKGELTNSVIPALWKKGEMTVQEYRELSNPNICFLMSSRLHFKIDAQIWVVWARKSCYVLDSSKNQTVFIRYQGIPVNFGALFMFQNVKAGLTCHLALRNPLLCFTLAYFWTH